jgi:Predicted hydrolases or acyltransferases (alpha/beta hydrolase superfamily)
MKRAASMESWPQLARYAKHVEIEGIGSLFCYDTASPNSPVVVLVHGLGDEADSWRHLMPLLAKGARIIALDLPGFGRSTAARRVTLGLCADAVIGLLEAEGIARATIVGSSLGAAVAQLAAMRDSGRIAALGLVDGGIPGLAAKGGAWRMLAPGLGERSYAGLRGRAEAAYASLAPYYADIAALAEEDRAFLRARVVQRVESDSQMRAYFSLLRSLALWASVYRGLFRKGLADFEGPVLVAWGEKDSVAPPSAAELLSGIAKRATKLVIAGAGHLPQQERPEPLAAAILELAAAATH